MPPRVMSFVGIFAMLFLAWLMSSHKSKVNLRIVAGGLGLQFVLALLILKTQFGREAFEILGDFFTGILSFVDEGSAFVFDIFPRPGEELPPQFTLLRSFAFGILPTIIFFSSLMSILYYLGRNAVHRERVCTADAEDARYVPERKRCRLLRTCSSGRRKLRL